MSKRIYSIKIQLSGSKKPPIWRKVELDSTTILADFSEMILTAMGWDGYHLHCFRDTNGEEYHGSSIGDFTDWAVDQNSDTDATVAELFEDAKNASYEYDFGDGWEHKLTVEKVFAPEQGVKYPRLSGGKGACPPEDCGGIYGYYHLLEAINDLKHEEHEELREWLDLAEGETLDPNEFDLEVTQNLFANSF